MTSEKEGESTEQKGMAKGMSPAMLQVHTAVDLFWPKGHTSAVSAVGCSHNGFNVMLHLTHLYLPGLLSFVLNAGCNSGGMCWVDGGLLWSDHDQQVHHVLRRLCLSYGP